MATSFVFSRNQISEAMVGARGPIFCTWEITFYCQYFSPSSWTL